MEVRHWRRERLSVHATNAGIAIVFVGLGLGLTLGFERVLPVQLPIMVIASIIGVWLFAVQHRFEETRWQRDAEWRFGTACRLPGRGPEAGADHQATMRVANRTPATIEAIHGSSRIVLSIGEKQSLSPSTLPRPR